MFEWMVFLPFAISIVFFAIMVRRVHGITALMRNPEQFGHQLNSLVETALRESGFDPSSIPADQLHEIDRLPADAREAVRARLLQAVLRGELDLAHTDVHTHGASGQSQSSMGMGMGAPTGLGGGFENRPPPIDRGRRGGSAWVALAIVLITGLVAALWVTGQPL